MPVPIGSGRWELYDLASDPAETLDLAKKFEKKVQQLREDDAGYRAAQWNRR